MDTTDPPTQESVQPPDEPTLSRSVSTDTAQTIQDDGEDVLLPSNRTTNQPDDDLLVTSEMGALAVENDVEDDGGGDDAPETTALPRSLSTISHPVVLEDDRTNTVPVVAHQVEEEQVKRSWDSHKKHILIMSSAGKPIYTRYGDESQLSSMFGMIQAIVARSDENVQCISSPEQTIVFLLLQPIYLVAISATGEPPTYLLRVLEMIYAQILFHFTKITLTETFRRKPGFDLRSLLGNANGEIAGLIKTSHYSIGMFMNSVPTLLLENRLRAKATEILASVRHPDLLFAVLLADSRLVTMVTPRKRPLSPSDLLLLINFVNSTHQLRTQETWTPLCLPEFNDQGFLHTYCAYLSEHVCLMLMSASEDLEQFHYCSEAKGRVVDGLKEANLISAIENVVEDQPLLPSRCEAPSAIHMLFKSVRVNQSFETTISPHAPMHNGKKQRKALIRRYIGVHELVHEQKTAPTSAYWDVRAKDAVLAVTTDLYEMYATFHPFTTAVEASAICNQFRLWVRREASNLFLGKIPEW